MNPGLVFFALLVLAIAIFWKQIKAALGPIWGDAIKHAQGSVEDVVAKPFKKRNMSSSSNITISGGGILKDHSGKTILVVGNRIFIDGKDVTPDAKQIKIEVFGNIDVLDVDACNTISISGSCASVAGGSANITIGGHVTGRVHTGSGDISISGSVASDVQTGSGDVNCGDVKGSVKTGSGDVIRK